MTQEQLAEAIERSTDTVSNIETGRLSTRIETALKLSQTLGVSLTELFDIEDSVATSDPEHRLLLNRMMQIIAPLDAATLGLLLDINQRILALSGKGGPAA
jgi:DNA-binding XRE family transcriptional regulator